MQMLTATEPNYYESGFPKTINRTCLNMPVNSRLRIARERKGYTLARATKELNKEGINCALSTLQSYEAAEKSINRRLPSIKMLLSLSYLYECSTDYLLGITDEINPYTTDIYSQLQNNKGLQWKSEKIDDYQLKMIVHKINQIMSI
jgi:transcriptional regulator with XRE-family HTH domain